MWIRTSADARDDAVLHVLDTLPANAVRRVIRPGSRLICWRVSQYRNGLTGRVATSTARGNETGEFNP
jgi:hypothetical protein